MNIKNPIVLFLLGAATVIVIVVGISIGFHAGKQSVQAAVPPVPVEITYRRSVVGNGYVFRFTDKGTTELFCTVAVRNSATGKQYRLDLRPKDFREIGVVQGWEAFPGDTCTVDADGFTQIGGKIPTKVN